MAERDRIEQRETTGDMHMADLPPYPDSNGDTGVGPDRGSPPSTPRWVKVFAIIAIVLVLLFVILQVAGGDHGPSRHSPSGADLGGRTSYSSVIEDHISSEGDLGGHTLPSSVTQHGVQQL